MGPEHFSFDQETLRIAATSGLLVLSAFCAHLLLMTDTHRNVRRPLALFFLATSVELLAIPAEILLPAMQKGPAAGVLELAEVPLTIVKPFLLWLYVIRLTRDPTQIATRHRWVWHAAPIVFAFGLYAYVMFLPHSLRAGLHLDANDLTATQRIAVIGLYAATALFFVLVPIYAVLILQRLRRYRHRLKDLFASTEQRELAWAWWLATMTLVFWGFNVVSVAAEVLELRFRGAGIFSSLPATILVQYVLIWSIAIWGVRQRPGIVPPPAPEAAERPKMQKYGNSGLNHDRLDRIAAKINLLMGQQRLFLEPDLSLWDLANRIGVTTHYASQALNDRIGERFFDYVNGWRVREAAERLRATDTTIMTVAYDVGFNSRSSFYAAFKREFGKTPTQYRKAQCDS